ncbi:FxSxx-COOH system tetratricopeptide repeat protein [Nonomuraea sp. LP-02]|uniref:FxSxx-COOH system tetratricopeptide repeat protein n=1 Tax=Nonomuraea sp. LP-02 TaxID=3097960 RepID=UPI002E2FD97D|nr:FxSxx-COOH system tetratricopeptide repeat protein [Nonomuraea sp. LP-02]MED7931849.1 FxSxx-COOH system tetratricopeptide repeat protein [Nonomuraea sp. LP-02]
MSTADDTSPHGEEARRAQLRARASGQGQVYQSARDQTIHHHYPSAPAPGQIVEGDIPQRPPGFQPRESLLRQLAELLGDPAADGGEEDAGGGAAVICAVAGTPGVGKTMLAASYAWACQAARWPVVAWIAAETTDQILTGLAALAERLGVRRPDEDAAAAARRAKAWLAATTRPALLVFDNATDVNALRAWCPATGATRVVITTRNRAFARAYAPLEVEVFTAEQAEAFLQRRTRLTDPGGAAALAHELGHLPLALAQAATVIVRLRLDHAGYLELLRGFPVGDHLTAQDGDAYPAGAAEAILLSVTQAESALPFAHELLSILAVLSPSGVPLPVLSALSDAGPEAGSAPVRLREMLADLADTSLITFSEDGTTVLMHRLIQRVLCDRAARQGDLGTVRDQAVALLQDYTDTLPDGARTWAARAAVEMVIDQSDALYRRVPADELPEELLVLRIWCGKSLHDLAELARAVQLLEATFADCERVLGRDHPHTLACCTHLAHAYYAAQDLGRAIPLYEATLGGCEQVLGADHHYTLISRSNLAGAYHAAGDWRRALAQLEATLPDLERVLGRNHPDTLFARHNLAVGYQEAGDLSQAVRLFEAALAGREQELGSDHPSTLASRTSLAGAYQATGALKRAIRLFEATAGDYERVLGPDHPDTLTCNTHLANAYQEAGNLDQAIALFERTLDERERVLGPVHPSTLVSRVYLGSAYHAAGDLDRAVHLLEATASDYERVLGNDHPDTLTCRSTLAIALRSAGELKRAILLLKAGVSDAERVLGHDHPSTLTSRIYLADAYRKVGNLGRAIPLYEATLADRERVLGPDHPDTLASRVYLANAYHAAGDLIRAIALCTATLEACDRVLGSDHPTTRVVSANLAILTSEAARRRARRQR